VATPAAVKIGPGLLYYAPIGTAEPTLLTGAWPSGWVAMGYTEEGSEQEFEQTVEEIMVAEEFWPIRHVTTAMAGKVSAQLAEITATNLKRAVNGGTISSPTGGYVTFDPPAPTAQVSAMLGWDADDAQERWLFRQVFNVSTVTIPRKKGGSDDKSVIPVEFLLQKPTGVQPYKAWFAAALA
jgi:hypothetical protein